MLRHLRPALVLLVLLTVVTGAAYPLVVHGIARVAFAHRASGSLIERDGRVVGSRWIGQGFSSPRYFWGRPSATAPTPYAAEASSGSNLGPLHPALRDALERRVAELRASDPDNAAPIPVDLVSASASGLDPHVSPAAALWQVGRVARERGLDASVVRALVERSVEGRAFGILGEPRVNVLELNLALDLLR